MTNSPASADVVSAARDPRIRLAWSYWQRLRHQSGDDHLPGRQHIEPVDMVEFLPCVVLIDVEHHNGQIRFRHRLAGTHFFDLFGRDLTDLRLDEVGARGRLPAVAARYADVVRTSRPIYGVSPVPVAGREFIRYEHLTAPLASDGIGVDMLFEVGCALTGAARPWLSQAIDPSGVSPLTSGS